jgi:uncharacterized phage protein (TIGR02216 family)
LNAAARPADAFPWEEAMGFGFGVLRLSPSVFWAMTPRELDHAVRAVLPKREGVPDRMALAGMMAAFPDVRTNIHG